MNKEQKPQRSITPPYLSVAKLEELIELSSNRNYPKFSSDIFKKHGFNDSDAAWSVNALKFLGLVDDNGVPTSTMSKLRLTGDARKVEIEKIVRTAYKSLFDATEAPQNLPQDKLLNEFVVQYNMTRRLAESAVRVFLKLCEFSGLKEAGSIVSKKQTPRRDKAPAKERGLRTKSLGTGEETGSGNFSTVRVAEGRLTLGVPFELKERLLDDETLEEDWRTLRASLRSFADKYIPKKEFPIDDKAVAED